MYVAPDIVLMRVSEPSDQTRNTAIGEHVYAAWRRRLERAKNDYGYVAGQMKKAGLPIDVARIILFT